MQNFINCKTGKKLTMKPLHTILLITALVLLVATSAEARTYHRSCNVKAQTVCLDRNMVTVTFDEFTSTGSGGTYIPNTIRLRAYRKAVSCLNAAWGLRDSYGVPPECTEDSGISGFDIGSMNQIIRREACPAWPTLHGTIRVQVRGHISGDYGCGGSVTKKDKIIDLGEYEISCP